MYATYAEFIAEVDNQLLKILTDTQNIGEIDQALSGRLNWW